MAPIDAGEVLFNNLLSPRQSIAATHWEIMADRLGGSYWTTALTWESPPRCPCWDGHSLEWTPILRQPVKP